MLTTLRQLLKWTVVETYSFEKLELSFNDGKTLGAARSDGLRCETCGSRNKVLARLSHVCYMSFVWTQSDGDMILLFFFNIVPL